jgi:hypothetical protein
MSIAILIIFIYATLLFLIVNWLEYDKTRKRSGFIDHQFPQLYDPRI